MLCGMDAPPFQSGAPMPRPFRDCFAAFERLMPRKRLSSLTCLDIGMPSVRISSSLRALGGAWRTIARAPCDVPTAAAALGDDKVTCLNADGSIPYAPHSFDCLLVGPAMLAAVPDPVFFVRDCNRALKPSGLLLLASRMRRPLSAAAAAVRRAAPEDPRTVAFSEQQLYALLKTGFDVAESQWFGKFWHQLAFARGLSLIRSGVPTEEAAQRTARAFSTAAFLDSAMVFTRGHEAVFAARRRQWRERAAPLPHDGRSLGEAVLFNPPA